MRALKGILIFLVIVLVIVGGAAAYIRFGPGSNHSGTTHTGSAPSGVIDPAQVTALQQQLATSQIQVQALTEQLQKSQTKVKDAFDLISQGAGAATVDNYSAQGQTGNSSTSTGQPIIIIPSGGTAVPGTSSNLQGGMAAAHQGIYRIAQGLTILGQVIAEPIPSTTQASVSTQNPQTSSQTPITPSHVVGTNGSHVQPSVTDPALAGQANAQPVQGAVGIVSTASLTTGVKAIIAVLGVIMLVSAIGLMVSLFKPQASA